MKGWGERSGRGVGWENTMVDVGGEGRGSSWPRSDGGGGRGEVGSGKK